MNVAWYRDESEGDPRTLHRTDPPEYLDPRDLYRETGVKYEKIPDSVCDDDNALKRFPAERSYRSHDFLEIDRRMFPNEGVWLTSEHLHDDPEIRAFLAGGAFFDIRSRDDRWIRVHAQKGDLLELPPGIWHRFCLDQKNYTVMMRLYKEAPRWEAEYRESSSNPPARDRYRKFMESIPSH